MSCAQMIVFSWNVLWRRTDNIFWKYVWCLFNCLHQSLSTNLSYFDFKLIEQWTFWRWRKTYSQKTETYEKESNDCAVFYRLSKKQNTYQLLFICKKKKQNLATSIGSCVLWLVLVLFQCFNVIFIVNFGVEEIPLCHESFFSCLESNKSCWKTSALNYGDEEEAVITNQNRNE